MGRHSFLVSHKSGPFKETPSSTQHKECLENVLLNVGDLRLEKYCKKGLLSVILPEHYIYITNNTDIKQINFAVLNEFGKIFYHPLISFVKEIILIM